MDCFVFLFRILLTAGAVSGSLDNRIQHGYNVVTQHLLNRVSYLKILRNPRRLIFLKNVTMRDIAGRIGVSVVSVSKALSGDSGVSQELREKIVRLATEMGYVNPNTRRAPAAKSLDIGVLVPMRFFKPDSYYAMLAPMLVQELTNAGHFCLLETLDEAAEEALELPNLIRRRHVDGLILLGEPTNAYLQAIITQPTPLIFLDFYDDRGSAPAVVGDNTYGAYRLTNHLIKNGHRDIAYVGRTSFTSSVMDRFLGYYRAMLAAGLPVRPQWILDDRDEHGDVRAPQLPQEMPTAFVCNCDLTAHRLMEALLARGYRIPEDVSVVGFDDYPATPSALPALSSFRLDYEAMLRSAVQLISDCCANQNAMPGRLVIGGHPRYKDSDGPAPRP